MLSRRVFVPYSAANLTKRVTIESYSLDFDQVGFKNNGSEWK